MKTEQDPKGLIFDSYRIEGISAPECRSIFLDWAISVPQDVEAGDAVRVLLDTYRPEHPHHPMTKVLEDALAAPKATGRRGGARARRSAGT